jgi:GNAT superfamily N-acetyltransferase
VKEEVRPATTDDGELLEGLYRAGASEIMTFKAQWADLDARPEPIARSFQDELDREDTAAFIGMIDGAPVGYAVVRLAKRLPQAGGLHAKVTDMYVDPGAREVGIGEELINAVLAWARERGAKSAEVRVVPGHRAAKNFCEENGLTARLIVMHRDL